VHSAAKLQVLRQCVQKIFSTLLRMDFAVQPTALFRAGQFRTKSFKQAFFLNHAVETYKENRTFVSENNQGVVLRSQNIVAWTKHTDYFAESGCCGERNRARTGGEVSKILLLDYGSGSPCR
jgi:hypothetical protein